MLKLINISFLNLITILTVLILTSCTEQDQINTKLLDHFKKYDQAKSLVIERNYKASNPIERADWESQFIMSEGDEFTSTEIDFLMEKQEVIIENNRKLAIENSIIDMVERNVYDPNAPVKGNARNLISYIDGMKTESEIYRNWADYFSENRSRPLLKLYPTDHWMHSSSQFNKNLSQQFEKDGFCWTPNGGAWKIGLTLEVAKAEVDLAKAKSR